MQELVQHQTNNLYFQNEEHLIISVKIGMAYSPLECKSWLQTVLPALWEDQSANHLFSSERQSWFRLKKKCDHQWEKNRIISQIDFIQWNIWNNKNQKSILFYQSIDQANRFGKHLLEANSSLWLKMLKHFCTWNPRKNFKGEENQYKHKGTM